MNPASFSTLTNPACYPKSCSQTSPFSGMGTVPKVSHISFSFRFIFSILMIFSWKCIAIDTVTQSQGISLEQTLVSQDQMFELGFFSRGNSSYLGIWFKSVLKSKVVWVANRDNPLKANDKNSSLTIGKDGNLRLVDGLNNVVWSTNISSRPNNTIAVLSNKGDFTLYDNMSKSSLWESFNHPGDSFISGMSIGTSKIAGESRFLSSWKDEDDPTQGVYVGGLTMETPPQIFVWKSSKPYWRTGPWDGWRFIGVSNMGGGYTNGFVLTPDNQHGSASISYVSPTSSRVTVVVLTPDGILKLVHWDIKGQTQDGIAWQSILVSCDVYGSCGPFGVCDRNGTRSCHCLKGFVAKSREEWGKGNFTSGCVRRTELTCAMNTSNLSSSNGKTDKFVQLTSMKLPDYHTYIFGLNSSGCLEWCLRNCSCNAYAYSAGINCLVWSGDLVDIQKFSSTGTDLFLRLAYSETDEKKTNMKLVISLATVSGAILLGICFFGLYMLRKTTKARRRHISSEFEELEPTTPLGGQPLRRNNTTTQTEKSDLPMFDFFTLSVATNHFSEGNKLGGGGFGPVFKGKLEDGLEIAVKRLSSHSGQGAGEFKNEILLISKLQHRNLVKLLGYCIKGDEKLLIYEYLKNKSLDYFLFDTKSRALLDWDKRLNIIQGIARGLLYLHRDSRLRIIHRDLKAGNILLDDNMDPKISDFGLARVFEVTQELANTHRVVGTFGYMSPEYAMGGLFSEKSDVYSFGILLLEIISGRRNTSFFQNEKHNLLSYAWELWKEGKGVELIDPTLIGSCPNEEFLQCLHIAILCVQDHAVDRPTMSSVVLMLTTETDLPKPMSPTFYQKMLGSDLRKKSSSVNSASYVTISQVEGR